MNYNRRKKCPLLLILVFSFVFLNLTSCTYKQGLREAELVKQDFAKYYNEKNEVVLTYFGRLYFEEYTLDYSIPYDSVIFSNNKLYYADLRERENSRLKDIKIFECDLDGNNEKVIYTVDLGLSGSEMLFVRTYMDTYFFRYRIGKMMYVAQYTLSTGIYKNIASGEELEIDDFVPKETSKYDIQIFEDEEYGGFKVSNSETGETRVIDDSYLRKTIYAEAIEKYARYPRRYDISNGHILLSYDLCVCSGWYYSHLIFEYDFENDALEYKALLFPYSFHYVKIIYIGE